MARGVRMNKLVIYGGKRKIYTYFGITTGYSWSGSTHEDIVKKSLELLKKENKNCEVDFYKNWHNQIIKGCTQPDGSFDMDKGSGMHYYSCLNPQGGKLPAIASYYRNRHGKFRQSARTLFEDNYTSAVSLYKSGNYSQGMLFLGRAVHFIADIGCTVHTSNSRYFYRFNNIHYSYEKFIGNSYKNYTADGYDDGLTKYYQMDNVGEAINKLAKFSSKYITLLSNRDVKSFDEAAQNTLSVTQQHCMAVLLKFYRDCCADYGNFVVDGQAYLLKNEISGLYLTKNDMRIHLDRRNNALEQKFQINLLDNGLITINNQKKEFIKKNFKFLDKIANYSDAAQFRISAVGRRQFVISSQSSGFEKVLTGKDGCKVSFCKFLPGNKAQIWNLY